MLAKKYKLTAAFFNKNDSAQKNLLLSRQSNEFNLKVFNSPLNYSQFAVIAPLSVFKKTTERNKYKRIVYEAIRKLELYKIPQKNVVIYLKSAIIGKKSQEMEMIVSDIFKKIK